MIDDNYISPVDDNQIDLSFARTYFGDASHVTLAGRSAGAFGGQINWAALLANTISPLSTLSSRSPRAD